MENTNRPSWDEYFMFSAVLAATRSSCKHLHTGAVVIKDKRIIAAGYNGAPPGIVNCLERGCRKDREGVSFDDKGKGVCRGIHAELNALSQVSREVLKDANTTLYTVYLPCSSCAKFLVGAGIKEVVYLKVYEESDILTKELFSESGTILRQMTIDSEKLCSIIKEVLNRK